VVELYAVVGAAFTSILVVPRARWRHVGLFTHTLASLLKISSRAASPLRAVASVMHIPRHNSFHRKADTLI
jgi:hypothetical protein